MYDKTITYDRQSRDYNLYLDDQYVGSRATYHEAENTLDDLIFDLIADSPGDDEGPNPPGDPSPDEDEGDSYPKCAACDGAHHIQQCPEIARLLLWPAEIAALRPQYELLAA